MECKLTEQMKKIINFVTGYTTYVYFAEIILLDKSPLGFSDVIWIGLGSWYSSISPILTQSFLQWDV